MITYAQVDLIKTASRLFAGIRIKQGWHENPNCEQFGYAFRKSVVLVSLDSRSAGKNCVTDDDFVLISHADNSDYG